MQRTERESIAPEDAPELDASVTGTPAKTVCTAESFITTTSKGALGSNLLGGQFARLALAIVAGKQRRQDPALLQVLPQTHHLAQAFILSSLT